MVEFAFLGVFQLLQPELFEALEAFVDLLDLVPLENASSRVELSKVVHVVLILIPHVLVLEQRPLSAGQLFGHRLESLHEGVVDGVCLLV